MADVLVNVYRNLFLKALPHRERALLEPSLQFVDLPQGELLAEPGKRVSDVVFLDARHDLPADDDAGRHRHRDRHAGPRVGARRTVGARQSSKQRTRRGADHGAGWKMRAADFRAAVEKSRMLSHMVLLSSELTLAQMQQTAACNALHSAERRLCRWILQVRDRIDGDVIELTQDFLAQMLAVRRPTVTLIAQGLQNAGLIRYRRGRITIVDHAGLEKLACECVEEIRTKTRHILNELH